MTKNSPLLFIEINSFEFIFIAINQLENGESKLLGKNSCPIQGIKDRKIFDLDLVKNIFEKNIYSLEKKINFTFRETIIIIDNFNCSLINFSGFKKLNGSQLVKENITYIINSLKSKINEIENNKTILHIFNSKYFLDKASMQNLPIGLFGNFYSHELSFFLIDNNDFKNINYILKQCNLKIKKIISQNFLEGTQIINERKNLESFFKIEINKNISQIIFFENSSFKYKQIFNFGSDLIINDISKIIGLNYDNVKNFLTLENLSTNNSDEEYLDKKFFTNQNFRKVKKNLVHEIAKARINEFAEVLLYKNINTQSFLKDNKKIFLRIMDDLNTNCFKNDYKYFFSNKNSLEFNFLPDNDLEIFYSNASNLVQYGWKKEAIPVVQENKSIIARIFDLIS